MSKTPLKIEWRTKEGEFRYIFHHIETLDSGGFTYRQFILSPDEMKQIEGGTPPQWVLDILNPPQNNFLYDGWVVEFELHH